MIYLISKNGYISQKLQEHFKRKNIKFVTIGHSEKYQINITEKNIFINLSAVYEPKDDWIKIKSGNFLYQKKIFLNPNLVIQS